MQKKSIIAALFLGVTLLCAGCTANQTPLDIKESEHKEGKSIQIVTTLFPQYDFARQIAGERAEVTLLLPPGMESHSYDPTPGDMIKINNADLFVYTGENMESWAKRIISGLDGDSTLVLDVSKNVALSAPEGDGHDENAKKADSHSHVNDPHIWTDPNNAMIMVDNILEALCKIDEENAYYYTENAQLYKNELKALDQTFRDVVANGARDEIVFGGKNAFHYFLKRYDLSYEGAYDSCAAEAEPSARVIAALMDEIKEDKIPVVYYEELSTPKVAKSISDETGAKMLLFHSVHNVSKDDFERGVTYVSIMKQNAENLKEGLK